MLPLDHLFYLVLQAANNLAVCPLYLGQRGEAIAVLESLTIPPQKSLPPPPQPEAAAATGSVPPPPPPVLCDTLVANLAVLYEVESEGSRARKLRLLERLAEFPGERVSAASVKLR